MSLSESESLYADESRSPWAEGCTVIFKSNETWAAAVHPVQIEEQRTMAFGNVHHPARKRSGGSENL